MIRKRTYLGIPMGPRRNRRVLVVCYWIAVVLILAGGAAGYLRDPQAFGSTWMVILVVLVFSFVPTLLGGQEEIGPVGDFDGDLPPQPRWMLLWVVDRLRSRRKRAPGERLFDRCFDERDKGLRDHAHYLSYQILRPIPTMAAAACLFLTPSEAHSFIRRHSLLLALLVILFSIVFWTLPQSIILWTEPDMEEQR